MLNRRDGASTGRNSSGDLNAFWMPFTANKRFKANPLMVAGAEMNHYVLEDGRRVLDSSAGLWCVNAGHGRTEIVEAIREQAGKLDFVSCFSNGHEGVFELASRLALLAPGNLDHVFFGNSGSEAVDTAMKIALAYHHAKGEGARTRFVGRQRAYHGVGFGGLSVGGLGGNRKQFGPLLPACHLPHTHDMTRNAFSKGQPEHGVDFADQLEGIFAANDASTIAAVIVEPIAGAGGLLPPPVGYLERLREICDRQGILLIFDEVITGFGRLGTTFAAEYFNVTPDMITCAKGLSNAAVPMGATIVSSTIYDTIVESSAGGPELLHGYTYSGHPLACAAALATLDVHAGDGLNEKATALGRELEAHVHALKGKLHVKDVRNLGVLAAVELEARPGKVAERGLECRAKALESGVMLRASGDTLLISPPLTLAPGDVAQIVDAIGLALEDIA